MKQDGDKTFVRVTQQMIYEQQLKHEEKLHQILEQTMRTNGRVTKLEATSVGMWISNNPFKFAMCVLVFISVVISDIRHPLIDFLMKIFI